MDQTAVASRTGRTRTADRHPATGGIPAEVDRNAGSPAAQCAVGGSSAYGAVLLVACRRPKAQ